MNLRENCSFIPLINRPTRNARVVVDVLRGYVSLHSRVVAREEIPAFLADLSCQANDIFFARKREGFFLAFFSRVSAKKNFVGVLLVFCWCFVGVFVLFGGVVLFFAR